MVKKKTTRKPVKTDEDMELDSMPAKSSANTSFVKTKRNSLIIGSLVVLLALGLLYYYRGVFVAAIVNGEPISRMAVVKDLEKQGGRQTLDSHVTKVLILQEAKKKNVTVAQSEIDGEIKKIDDSLKVQKQTLDAVLMQRGMSREELVDQIRVQKMIEKLVGKDIEVTDKEVTDYITQNQEAMGPIEDQAATEKQVKDQLKQQKLNEKFQSYLENLQKNAKISYFVGY